MRWSALSYNRTRGERGAAAVEFGLVAMLLFTLLFGIIQFGLWLWSWQTGAHAAREAARFAAVNPCTDADIEARGVEALDGAPVAADASGDDNGTWVVTRNGNPLKVGDEITVAVSFFTVDLQFFPGFDGAVDKSATSRVERVPAGGC